MTKESLMEYIKTHGKLMYRNQGNTDNLAYNTLNQYEMMQKLQEAIAEIEKQGHLHNGCYANECEHFDKVLEILRGKQE